MAMKPYGVELMNYIFGDFYRDTSILICLIVIWIMQKANRIGNILINYVSFSR